MHDVVLITKPIDPTKVGHSGPGRAATIDRIVGVEVDGRELLIPADATVTVVTGPQHLGHAVTVTLLAGEVTTRPVIADG